MRTPRKTKIIATYGPSVSDEETLSQVIQAGTDCIRINLAYGDENAHKKAIDLIRRVSAERHIAVMFDIPGPKLRLELHQPIKLKMGERLEISRTGGVRMSEDIPFSCFKEGERILLKDGRFVLRVEEVDEEKIEAVAETPAELKDGEGIAFPDTHLAIPSFCERDEKFLRLAAEVEVDWLSLSFVASADDIERARSILDSEGADIPVIAKIERREAVENLSAIVEESDAIMVARGDLGLSLGLDEVPSLQKKIIRTAVAADKVSIVATQMLQTMVQNPSPTRAEVSDVANAVIDGADALLLSGETAIGKYPVETVKRLSSIIRRTESEPELLRRLPSRLSTEAPIADAVSAAAVRAAEELNAPLICPFTSSGRTPILLSRYFPQANIVACTDSRRTAKRLSIVRGVTPHLLSEFTTMEKMFDEAKGSLVKGGHATEGDVVVFVSGTPVGVPGRTDTLHIRRI